MTLTVLGPRNFMEFEGPHCAGLLDGLTDHEIGALERRLGRKVGVLVRGGEPAGLAVPYGEVGAANHVVFGGNKPRGPVIVPN
jgi:hypothetical protein